MNSVGLDVDVIDPEPEIKEAPVPRLCELAKFRVLLLRVPLIMTLVPKPPKLAMVNALLVLSEVVIVALNVPACPD